MLKYRLILLKGLEELNYNKSQFFLQKYFLNNNVILKCTKKDYLSLGESILCRKGYFRLGGLERQKG